MKRFFYTLLFIFTTLLTCHAAGAGTMVLNDVNITNDKYKNIVGLFSNNTPKTFPYDEVYGATNFWTQWDLIRNEDNTYSFHIGGYYMSAKADNSIATKPTISDTERFHLEKGNGFYYLKTWRGSYLSAVGGAFQDLTQSWDTSSAEAWRFFNAECPTLSELNDVNISNFNYKTIVGVFSNSELKSFPYDEGYGADHYWVKWDIIPKGNDKYYIYIGGQYLSATKTNGISIVSNPSSETLFTLVRGVHGAFHIQSSDAYYLAATGPGFNTLSLDASQSIDTQWYFFSRNDVEAFTPNSN